jgi:hypothetical protein
VVRLADYWVQLPAGFTVSRIGSGLQARGPDDSFIELFVVSGFRAGPAGQLARLRADGDPARLVPVTVDGFAGTMLDTARGAELWVRVPSRGTAHYLLAKALGPPAVAALPSFAREVRILQLPVVNLGCQLNCS